MNSSTLTIAAFVAPFVVIGALIVRWKRDWLFQQIAPAEILRFETVAERREVIKRVSEIGLKSIRFWLVVIGYGVAGALPGAALIVWAGHMVATGQWGIVHLNFAIAFFGLCMLSTCILLCRRFRKWLRLYLRKHLNDSGMPTCLSCGYDLRGQHIDLCPECGMKFSM